jgi:hypothetical protein
VLNERGDVLVARDVDGIGFFDEFQSTVAGCLWPSVRIEVGVKAVFARSVEVSTATGDWRTVRHPGR